MQACARSKGRTPVARLAERDRHLLAVAEQLFLEQGYHQVSLALVASSAGVATRTIYASFGEKRALLEAVLACRREAAERELCALEVRSRPLAFALHGLAEHAFEHALSPDLDLLYADLLAERAGPVPPRHGWAIEGPWRALLEDVLPARLRWLADVFVACLMRERLRASGPAGGMARRAVARFLECSAA